MLNYLLSNISRIPFLSGKSGSPTESQDQLAPPSGLSDGTGKDTEEGTADIARPEVRELQQEIEYLKGRVESDGVEIARLREERETLIMNCKHGGDRIAELEHEVGWVRGRHQEDVQKQIQYIRAVEERLKRTEELLATRSAELSGVQAFLSTTDRLSEAEVLNIVRDLNENIYQVATTLTEEWENLESPQATIRTDADPASCSRVPALVQLVRNRDSMGLVFLFQSRLCSQVVSMTSSWDHDQELAILKSIYERLSASEGQAVSARWRSLTHNYLSRPLPRSTSLVEQLASVLDETGSFSSTQHSFEFVQAVASERIESIIRLVLRLELVFKVEVTSSDMSLLFGAPDTVFDNARMADEFGSDGTSISGNQDRVAGTTEVGVGKSVSMGPDEILRTGVLLKTKVVLEKDVGGDEA